MRSYIKYIVCLLVLALVGYGAFLKFGPIKPFPTKAEIADALNVEEAQVLAIYDVTERYRYVAYTNNDVPQQSYWKFHNRKWQPVAHYSGHEIMLWNTDDVKTMTWNFVGENMHTLNVFAILDRNYNMSIDEKGTEESKYFPQIVLKQSFEIDATTSHGVFQLPAQWHEALNRMAVNDSPFDFFDYEDVPLYHWEVRDAAGNVVETNRPGGTSGTLALDGDDSTFDFVTQYTPLPVEEHTVPIEERSTPATTEIESLPERY